MTIKEMEEQSGMTRANIRFYEAEGLLKPKRLENGYRDYSEDDLDIIKRIKLLRTLQISLEEIKSMQKEERELSDILDAHLKRLQTQKTETERSQKICEAMRSDGVQYQTLDAQHYLDAIEWGTGEPVAAPDADVLPRVRSPWRRYFARCLDFFFYSVLWEMFLCLALHENLAIRSTQNAGALLLDTVVVLLLMLFVEPLFLCLFGTTPGKWIMGLSVTDQDGNRMTYASAKGRTFTVLLWGEGFYIPVFRLFRLITSYRQCKEGKALDWEEDSVLVLKERKGWKMAAAAAAYIGAYVLLAGGLILAVKWVEMPKNRGEITVAEFCENYNKLAAYYQLDVNGELDEKGNWASYGNEVFLYGEYIKIPEYEEPPFQFLESGGIMKGMRFTVEVGEEDEWVPSYQNEMLLAVLAFAKAQKGSGLFANETEKVVRAIIEDPHKDFAFSAYGVQITCDIAYSGYKDFGVINNMLVPKEGAKPTFSLCFSMQKQE